MNFCEYTPAEELILNLLVSNLLKTEVVKDFQTVNQGIPDVFFLTLYGLSLLVHFVFSQFGSRIKMAGDLSASTAQALGEIEAMLNKEVQKENADFSAIDKANTRRAMVFDFIDNYLANQGNLDLDLDLIMEKIERWEEEQIANGLLKPHEADAPLSPEKTPTAEKKNAKKKKATGKKKKDPSDEKDLDSSEKVIKKKKRKKPENKNIKESKMVVEDITEENCEQSIIEPNDSYNQGITIILTVLLFEAEFVPKIFDTLLKNPEFKTAIKKLTKEQQDLVLCMI